MSKPDAPKKIEPLPAHNAADAKSAAPKKTGWEPPSPKQPRVSERKLGMLLAVCLLVALGFVAYRKFHSRPLTNGASTSLAQFGKLPPDEQGKPSPDASASQPLPPADLGDAGERALFADNSSAAPREETGFFGSASPAETPEAKSGAVSRSTPTFDLGASEPPAQVEPETAAADESSNPFFTAAEATDTTAVDAAVVSSDPFVTGGSETVESDTVESDTSTFSSDAVAEFGAPADQSDVGPSNELTFSEPPVQTEPEEPAASSPSTAPVVGLFGIEPEDEPAGEPVAETEPATTAPVDSPWGAGTIESNDAAPLAEAEPPLIEPNDPQVMPTLTLGPFDGAAADSATVAAPVVDEPVESGSGFNPYPAATVESPVQQHLPTQAPQADQFTSGGTTTVVERARNPLHDPFVPARDVRHAIREDEVHVHEVRSGDNFWSIAQEHYGSGKYFTALAAYNQNLIPDPRRIRPGMQVQVPSATVLAQQFPQLVSGGASVPYSSPPAGPPGFTLDAHGRPSYRISKGDTLSGIAQKHLGRASRWRQIFGMNIDQLTSADSLTTGMVLRLPADASQFRMDAAGIERR